MIDSSCSIWNMQSKERPSWVRFFNHRISPAFFQRSPMNIYHLVFIFLIKTDLHLFPSILFSIFKDLICFIFFQTGSSPWRILIIFNVLILICSPTDILLHTVIFSYTWSFFLTIFILAFLVFKWRCWYPLSFYIIVYTYTEGLHITLWWNY